MPVLLVVALCLVVVQGLADKDGGAALQAQDECRHIRVGEAEGLNASFLEVGSRARLKATSKLRWKSWAGPFVGSQDMNEAEELSCRCTGAIPTVVQNINPNGRLEIPATLFPTGSCAAMSLRIYSIRHGSGMTKQQVRSHIGNPMRATWTTVMKHHFSDIDGRNDQPTLCTLGGDLVEFINGLDAMEAYIDDDEAKLKRPRIENMLRKYVQESKKASFYMVTDKGSMTNLARAANMQSLDPSSTPAGDKKQKLLDNCANYDNVGCRILKEMISKPGDWGLRLEIVVAVIQSFYAILWDKGRPEHNKMRLVVLDGQPAEEAWVEVYQSQACLDMGYGVMTRPYMGYNMTSMFVVHRDAVGLLRDDIGNFIARQDSKIEAQNVKNTMTNTGDAWNNRARWKMASGKPWYKVVFD